MAKAQSAETGGDHHPPRRRLLLLLGVRAAVVTALLGSTLFFALRDDRPGLASTQWIVFVLAGLVYLLSALYALWLRRPRGPLGLHLQIQTLFDVLLASVLVYISGGIESPFTFFYALPIITSAVFFNRRSAMVTAGLACLLLGGLYVLESQGLIPLDLEGRLHTPISAFKVVYLLAVNYAVFLLIAWLAGSLGEQLRRTGRELEQSEQEVEALVALNRDIVLSLRSGLVALDAAGRVSLLNPVAEEILGCAADAASGRPVEQVFPALAVLPAEQKAEAASEQAGLRRFELDHEGPDGRRVPVGLTFSPLTRADGSPVGTLLHMQDLTRFKAMEEQMKKGERLAALGGMAAALAHELRNPLASISGSVQMLAETAGAEGAEARLREIILREARRLDALLSDFLTYARPRPPRRASTALDELVAETVDLFEKRSGAPARVERHLESLRALVDPDQLRQVLLNLLLNAEQAAGEAAIAVELRPAPESGAGAAVEIAVRDQGPGVPDELRERVFEPFVSTKEQGTGLGLAIVAQIVEAHGGAMVLECPADGGSLFRIRLPQEDA